MHYGVIKKFDIANGPGVRVSLFVSGCRNHCKGCFNSETWDFNYGKEFIFETVKEISDLLNDSNIRGLSILGGDPFEPENQECVKKLCEYVRKNNPGKDIWVWTGYKIENLLGNPILELIDILVDGPFIESRKDLRLKYRGSNNQRVIDVQNSLKLSKIITIE